MKRLFTILPLTVFSIFAMAQQQPLKPRADAFPPVKEPVDAKAIVMANTVGEMDGWDRYPTYPVYLEMMQRWVETYPTLCHLDTIGTSVQGRLILSLYIAPDTIENRNCPEFFYSSTIHGDELTGYVMMLRLIDTLLSSYGTSTQITALLNTTRISINPLANPDGTYWGGDLSVSRCQRNNADNIDLNRSFPDPFAVVAVGDGCSAPASASKYLPRENQAMIDYFATHDFRLSANLHGGAEVMNYPWDSFTSRQRPHPAAAWWQEVGRRFVDTVWAIDDSRFRDACQDGVIAGGDWFVISGGRQDYVTYYYNCLEMTMELSVSKELSCNQLPRYWRLLAKSLINYIGEIHSLPENLGIPSEERQRPSVYPNPTSRFVTVCGSKDVGSVELLDMTGRAVQTVMTPNNGVVTLDLGTLIPGIYLLRTTEGSAKIIKR